MKRKIILSISLMILIGLSVFVYAYSYTSVKEITSSNPDYEKIIQIYGPPQSENINDYKIAEVTYPVKKGWNFIPKILVDQVQNQDTPAIKSSCWDQSKTGTNTKLKYDLTIFDYLYVYDENTKQVFPEYENNGYVGGKIGDWTTPPLSDYFDNKFQGGPLGSYFSSIPVTWVYSPRDCEMIIYASIPKTEQKMKEEMSQSLQQINNADIKLKKGWQIILMLTLGHNFNEIKGDCVIEEVNVWDPSTQKYAYESEDEMRNQVGILNTLVTSDIWLHPVFIKVKDECTMHYSGDTNEK